MNPFVHLHCHTDYSQLDGCARIDRLVERASALGMPALAITDHGNLFGVIDFYQKARARSIRPLVGSEIYLVIDHAMSDHPSRVRAVDGEETGRDASLLANKIYHMGLLARNEEGYRNLVKLSSLAHTRGMYYRPRVDFETLARHAGGLIGFTGCLQGVVPQHLLKGERDGARRWMGRMVEVFGKEFFFVELQRHGLHEQDLINRDLLELAREFGLKAVASNDVHYVEHSHHVAHDLLLCIQTGAKVNDADRLRYSSNEFYLKSRQEMELIFGERPDLLDNTLAVAEMCQLEIKFGENHFPVFDPGGPVRARCPTNADYLRELSLAGLEKRYGVRYGSESEAADPGFARLLSERVDYELSIIGRTGFVDYFLIVSDFIDWARQRRIPVGPGRGSGAGCLVAYCTGITDTDPMRFKLLFERMLNPERVSPPDFDIDFCMRRRDEVIEYVRQKYGAGCVANIITFGTFGAKSVVHNLARVLDLEPAFSRRISKMVPDDPKITIEDAIARSAELKQEIAVNPVLEEILSHGRVIEGMVRSTGKHAAGILIADRDLTDYVPVTIQESALTTQYPKGPVEELGLLKMDFLGLKTLTVISDAEKHVRRTVDPAFSVGALSYDDGPTFALLNEARTVGVFQMESAGMQSLCRQFAISSIDEIVALIALYRPGPMENIPTYIRGKREPETIQYPHPLLRDLLAETYGVMVYQEQVMEAARILAGYTLGGADILRRAMGKKKVEEMEKQREVFVAGAKACNGIERGAALELFALLEKFAGYGFNKSHSAAYAILTYQTAFLKANYPIQFMAAVLSCELGNSDNLAKFLDECLAMDLDVRGPDINHSLESFTPRLSGSDGSSAGSILFGLGAVKGVGDGAAHRIIEEREANGPFTDLRDFLSRVDAKAINLRVLENLIRAGAFDFSGVDRGVLLQNLDTLVAEAESLQRDRARGQINLFDLLESSGPTEGSRPLTGTPMPLDEKLQHEKELLGFYASGHPMNAWRGLAERISSFAGDAYRGLADRTPYRLCGVVTAVSKKISRKDNRPWAVLGLSSRESAYSMNIYSDAYERCQANLLPGRVLVVTGSVQQRESESVLTVDSALPLEDRVATLVRSVTWLLHPDQRSDGFLELLEAEMLAHPGETRVELGWAFPEGCALLAEIPSVLRWRPSGEGFGRLLRHPAVIRVSVETADIPVREPSWKSRTRRPAE